MSGLGDIMRLSQARNDAIDQSHRRSIPMSTSTTTTTIPVTTPPTVTDTPTEPAVTAAHGSALVALLTILAGMLLDSNRWVVVAGIAGIAVISVTITVWDLSVRGSRNARYASVVHDLLQLEALGREIAAKEVAQVRGVEANERAMAIARDSQQPHVALPIDHL